MSDGWHVEVHRGNPSMARVVGPKFKAMHECEDGGWYTDVITANLIASAPDLLEAAKNLERRAAMIYVAGLSKSEADMMRDAFAQLTAAISKATQQSPPEQS